MNDYVRDSRLTGLWQFSFKVRGKRCVIFDHIVVARHGAEAHAEVRALFGHRVIGLQEIRRLS
jgi:hypothetical protein